MAVSSTQPLGVCRVRRAFTEELVFHGAHGGASERAGVERIKPEKEGVALESPHATTRRALSGALELDLVHLRRLGQARTFPGSGDDGGPARIRAGAVLACRVSESQSDPLEVRAPELGERFAIEETSGVRETGVVLPDYLLDTAAAEAEFDARHVIPAMKQP